MISVDRTHDRAMAGLFWRGGARSELTVKLNRRTAKRTTTPEDLVELIRRLASRTGWEAT